ncbi:MAG: hypothetical protein D6755_00050 [Anaerolineae bacterium]|nr:MAG: hypothetical protein D6755_00050 [Anaerolineae bacterium]
MIPAGGQEICFLEHARTLLGQPLADLIVEGGTTVLLFPDGRTLPLIGWNGNARAQNPESADALLDALDGLYLTGVGWNDAQGYLLLGDETQTHWRLHLRPEK